MNLVKNAACWLCMCMYIYIYEYRQAVRVACMTIRPMPKLCLSLMLFPLLLVWRPGLLFLVAAAADVAFLVFSGGSKM